MATVDWETTVGIMLMFEFLDDLHQDKLLRRALEGLGTLDGAPFTGEDESSQRFIAGGEMRRDRSVTLRHPWINDISGEEEGWIKLSVM